MHLLPVRSRALVRILRSVSRPPRPPPTELLLFPPARPVHGGRLVERVDTLVDYRATATATAATVVVVVVVVIGVVSVHTQLPPARQFLWCRGRAVATAMADAIPVAVAVAVAVAPDIAITVIIFIIVVILIIILLVTTIAIIIILAVLRPTLFAPGPLSLLLSFRPLPSTLVPCGLFLLLVIPSRLLLFLLLFVARK
jgi:hypothetical protein